MTPQHIRILLIGKNGQLGWELNRTLATIGELLTLNYPQIDLGKHGLLKQTVLDHKPDILINAAGYTAVDKAEEQHDLVYAINSEAPGVLAETARKTNTLFIHFSTDYVFDGQVSKPYLETDRTNPVSVYGLSKKKGEQAVEAAGGNFIIIRTSWMYSLRRSNYLKKALTWARSKQELRIVDDQTGSPTSARMLAEITAQMLALGKRQIEDWGEQVRGLYHCAGEGYASRYEFTRAILKYDPNPEEQLCKKIIPVSSDEFSMPAKRPPFTALDCSKFWEVFGLRLPPWQDALQLIMGEIPSRQS